MIVLNTIQRNITKIQIVSALVLSLFSINSVIAAAPAYYERNHVFTCVPASDTVYSFEGVLIANNDSSKVSANNPAGLVGSPEFLPKNTESYCTDGKNSAIYWDGSSIREVSFEVSSDAGRNWQKHVPGKLMTFVLSGTTMDMRVRSSDDFGVALFKGSDIRKSSTNKESSSSRTVTSQSVLNYEIWPGSLDVPVIIPMDIRAGSYQLSNKFIKDKDGEYVYVYDLTRFGSKLREHWTFDSLGQLYKKRYFIFSPTFMEIEYKRDQDLNILEKTSRTYHNDDYEAGIVRSVSVDKNPSDKSSERIREYFDEKGIKTSQVFLKGYDTVKTIQFTPDGRIKSTIIPNNLEDKYYRGDKTDDHYGSYFYYDDFTPKQWVSYYSNGDKAYEVEYANIGGDEYDAKGKKPIISKKYAMYTGDLLQETEFDQFSTNTNKTYRAQTYAINGNERTLILTEYFIDGAKQPDLNPQEKDKTIQGRQWQAYLTSNYNVNPIAGNDTQYKQEAARIIARELGYFYDKIKDAAQNTDAEKEYYNEQFKNYTAKAERAIKGLAFGIYANAEDDYPYQQAASAYNGKDFAGNEFIGLWVSEKGKDIREGAFLDLTSPAAVKRSLDAANIGFNAMLNLPKRYAAGDSRFSGKSVFIDGVNGYHAYNPFASFGQGAYMNIDEFYKADPTTHLLLDKFFKAKKKEGVNLNNLSDLEVVMHFTKYFNSTYYGDYIADWYDSTQTLAETVAKGGGDCDDWAKMALSLLHNTFERIGRPSAASRVYISRVMVPSGHQTVTFKDSDGSYYHVEVASLFQGLKSDLPLERYISKFDPITWKNYSYLAEWNVELKQLVGKGGFRFTPSTSSYESQTENSVVNKYVAQTPTGSLGYNRGADLVAKAHNFIEPTHPEVVAIANEIIRQMGTDWYKQSEPYIVSKLNTIFANFVSYVSETGNDTWQRVNQSINNFVVRGDSEDIAFVEASVLNYVLAKYQYSYTKDKNYSDSHPTNQYYMNEALAAYQGQIGVVGEKENSMAAVYSKDLKTKFEESSTGFEGVLYLDYRNGKTSKYKMKDLAKEKGVAIVSSKLNTKTYLPLEWNAYHPR